MEAGNKLNNGTGALRFKIDDTSFAIISTHLNADGPALKRAENL